jgi:hypothetical protein
VRYLRAAPTWQSTTHDPSTSQNEPASGVVLKQPLPKPLFFQNEIIPGKMPHHRQRYRLPEIKGQRVKSFHFPA